MAVEIDAIQSAKSIGWTDALLSRLAANSVGLGARLSITAPANASALSSTGYSLTGSNASSMIDLDGTWNTTGTPTLIKANVTDTASNANSLLMDLQVGGTSRFSVTKAGALQIIGGGASGSGSIEMANRGLILQMYGTAWGVQPLICHATGGLSLVTNTSSLRFGTFVDLIIERDAANTLALRNSTNAQAFNIYNTYTSGSVYERGFMRWASNVLEIGTEHVGASARDLVFKTNNTERMRFGASGTMTVAGGVSTAFFDVITYFASTSAATSRSSAGSGFTVGSAYQYLFSSTTGANGSADVGLLRTIAGVVGITNGSTGAGALGLKEMTSPAAPATDGVYIFAEDNGSGKTRLMARFATGSAVQIAIEP